MTAAGAKTNERARARAGGHAAERRRKEGKSGYVCIGAYRKTEERRKKNSRKRSDALAEQKGTKLISEALTNYFLRKGVGYLQLSTRRSPPLSPSLYLFASEAANPPPPPSFVNQLVDRANTLMKKNINQADAGGRREGEGGGEAAAAAAASLKGGGHGIG